MGGGVGNLGVFTSYQAILEIMICAIAMSKVLLGLHDMVLCKPLIALFIHVIVNITQHNQIINEHNVCSSTSCSS